MDHSIVLFAFGAVAPQSLNENTGRHTPKGIGAGDQETDQPSYQRASKKKIEKDVGEYVDFEEVACRVDKTTEATTPDREQPAESQIEDIEWVDVPDKRK